MEASPRYQNRPTQIEAAKLAGIKGQGSVSDWNKPDRGPELKNAILLATKLNVCVEWLYTERGPMRPQPADDSYLRELLSVWGRLSDEDKAKLVGFAHVSAKGAPFAESSPESLPSSRVAF